MGPDGPNYLGISELPSKNKGGGLGEEEGGPRMWVVY